MDLDQSQNSSSDECIVLPLSPPPPGSPSQETETPQRSASKIRLSKADSAQRKSERDAKKAEEEAVRAEKKRQKDELKAKKAEEIQQEKARKAEELQQEKVRRAEERARKAEELLQEKARKTEELLQEKARKAEELLQEKARKTEELLQEKARRAEERARKEAENAAKKAELTQKKEQRQAAVQKQEMLNKQMANIMGKFFKPIDKSSSKDGSNGLVNNGNTPQRCTDSFDAVVCQQDTQFISDVLDEIKSMKKLDPEIYSRPRLNSDSNSSQLALLTTTSSFLIKTRYIHFPEKYFNRPPYYGSFKKALSVHIDPLKPDASIDNVDYTADSEGEWEEPCKDGEELRSDAEDLSDSEAVDSDSDSDSFIVPHGHLSDDELNEDEQQQSTSTKQAREAAKSHVWDKKVARRNQQRELKPIFGCIHDPILEEKVKLELSTYLSQFRRILVPKECFPRVEEEEITDESAPKEEKTKRMSKKKSLIAKKGLAIDSQIPTLTPNTPVATTPTTAKRTGSASNIVEGASPSKRRKVNSNENCSIIDDSDVLMIDLEAMNNGKNNVFEDASNVTEIKSSPLTVISNDEIKLDSTPTCTLLIPKRKQPPI